jgi:3-phenylpropionate/trans-cinnamate dioxygenase ferredoxin reductase subunit
MPGGTQRIVIVGAGQAGCQVATSLRQGGFAGSIVLVGAERHLPYQRPPLSKGHLTGKVARESLWLRPESWFAENGVELRLGERVTSIDRAAHLVHLGEDRLDYEILVLALGSRHRELSVSGTDLDGVVSLRDLDEADDIRTRLESATDVVVIGGGFIGMEVASTGAALGKRVTVVEVAPQLMGRVLSAPTACFLHGAHCGRGLTVSLSATLQAILGESGRVSAVAISDSAGERVVPADLVLIGIGALPQTGLAEQAGLTIENGIAVDEYLRTSDPDVYAIGDCVSVPNPFAGGRRVRLESVQNATAQGRDVAATIVGKGKPHHAVPWFWSDQADLKLQIAGLTTGHDEVVLRGEVGAEKFSAYCFTDGRLVGVESVNSPAEHMAARRLVAAEETVTPDQVRDPAFNAKAAATR